MQRNTSPQLSLEQIENDFWGDAPANSGYLIRAVHRLRSKPIGLLEAEDLRVMIGQNVGNKILVPIAIGHLAREPLLEGDFYPGDVLAAVLGVDEGHWAAHPEQLREIQKIVSLIKDPPPPLPDRLAHFLLLLKGSRHGQLDRPTT